MQSLYASQLVLIFEKILCCIYFCDVSPSIKFKLASRLTILFWLKISQQSTGIVTNEPQDFYTVVFIYFDILFIISKAIIKIFRETNKHSVALQVFKQCSLRLLLQTKMFISGLEQQINICIFEWQRLYLKYILDVWQCITWAQTWNETKFHLLMCKTKTALSCMTWMTSVINL